MTAQTFSLRFSTRRRTMRRHARASLLLMLACVVGLPSLLLPHTVEACGPEFLNAHFVTIPRPEFPLEEYARGRIGVVRPTFARSYLVAAYRVLEGVEPDAGARRFAIAYTALRSPGLRPYVDNGIGRTTPFARIDSYRDNWWCALADFKGTLTASERAGESSNNTPDAAQPQFLSAAQRDAARDEWKRLAAYDTAPNFLTQEALNYAARHPEDPRVPEALHLSVKSTRYGCTNPATGELSRRAFTVLHTRYKGNAWTARTPLWFKQ